MSRKLLLASAAGLVILGLSGAAAYYVLRHEAAEIHPEVVAGFKSKAEKPTRTEAENAEITAKKDHIKKLFRQLGRAQDDIAYGVDDALGEQDRVIIEIAEYLDQIDVEDWLSPPDMRAILVYVLSGGEPDILHRVVAARSGTDREQNLAEGILRFAENDADKSRAALESVNPRVLESELMGPVALAKASLYTKVDPNRAIILLDDARLFNPHTAIEEAALRREIPLLLARGETRRGMMLTASYLRRFGKSAYRQLFLEDFSKAFVAKVSADDGVAVRDLDVSIGRAASNVRAETALAVAREALVKGRLKLAKAAAETTLDVADAPADQHDRARLYVAAAEAPTEQARAAADRLKALESKSFSDDDSKLRAAASDVATSVMRRPADVEPSAADNPSSAGPEAKDRPEVRVTGLKRVLVKAEQALKEVDAMMSRSRE